MQTTRSPVNPCFISSPNGVPLRHQGKFHSKTLPPRDSRRPAPRHRPCTAKADRSLRQLILDRRTPNVGTGGTPSSVPCATYPDLNLFTLTWHAVGKPVAGLLISPSLIWHSGWFSALGIALADAGVTSVSVDGLSSGRSDNLRGVRGLVLSLADYVDDLAAAISRMESSLPPGTPLFVLGESGGAITATMLAMDDSVKEKVTGYIFCGPAFRVKKELLPPQFVQNLVKVIGPIFPTLALPGDEIGGETWDEAFGDKDLAELSKEDPYVGYRVPILLGPAACLLRATDNVETALRRGQLEMKNVLILHKTDDVRTDAKQSEKFVERVVCEGSASYVGLEGPGHQLFQDTPEVTSDAIRRVVQFIVDTSKTG